MTWALQIDIIKSNTRVLICASCKTKLSTDGGDMWWEWSNATKHGSWLDLHLFHPSSPHYAFSAPQGMEMHHLYIQAGLVGHLRRGWVKTWRLSIVSQWHIHYLCNRWVTTHGRAFIQSIENANLKYHNVRWVWLCCEGMMGDIWTKNRKMSGCKQSKK